MKLHYLIKQWNKRIMSVQIDWTTNFGLKYNWNFLIIIYGACDSSHGVIFLWLWEDASQPHTHTISSPIWLLILLHICVNNNATVDHDVTGRVRANKATYIFNLI